VCVSYGINQLAFNCLILSIQEFYLLLKYCLHELDNNFVKVVKEQKLERYFVNRQKTDKKKGEMLFTEKNKPRRIKLDL